MEGLLLLLVVGAWLVVLVPMALRSHDTATANRSVDRFSGAMRVLARGDTPVASGREWVMRDEVPSDGKPVLSPAGPTPAGLMPAGLTPAGLTPAGLTPAARRRRTLFALLAASLLTLLVGLLGPAWVLGLSALLWGLTVAFVVHLRRLVLHRDASRVGAPVAVADTLSAGVDASPQTFRTAAPVWRPTASGGSLPLAEMARSPEGRAQLLRASPPVPTGWLDISGDEESTDGFVVLPATGTAAVPVAVPADVPADVPATSAAATAVDRMRPPTVGVEWTPVPVPPPSYVTQPPPPPRAVPDPRILTDGSELDGILEQRRAVGDW